MKILVCVKQVMDSESKITINESGKWIQYSNSTRFQMNTFDTYAVEEALQIKERYPGSRIHIITVGPDHAQDTLRRALGMGADQGIHIMDNRMGYRSPFQTATWIAAYAKTRAYDLILTGMMSDDEMNAQTGPMIAQILSLPFCTAVIHINLRQDQKTLSVEREIEGGSRDMFDIISPCVLTLQTGINTPRYPALSKVLRAKKKQLEIIDSKFFDKTKPGVIPKHIHPPEKSKKGVFLKGTINHKVDQLFDILENKTLL